MKKIVLSLIIILIISFSFCFAIETNCPNVILIDASNGRVLYEKGSNEQVAPASLTKVMTALLVLEKTTDLNEITVASRYAITSVPEGGSTSSIKIGETISISNLLKALLIASGNDAANVLAEYVSGNINDFVTLMNNRAQELGCKNTLFANPNGFSNPNHYSSAHDIAVIYKYTFDKFKAFRDIVSMESFTLPASDKYSKDNRTFKNTNELILQGDNASYYYEYCTGGKTGYTSGAKNCLVSSATKDGISLICVVLGGTQSSKNFSYRYIDTISLFNYGFDNLYLATIVSKDDILGSTNILNASKEDSEVEGVAKESIKASLDKAKVPSDFNKKVEFLDDLKAPIKKGSIIGKVTYEVYNQKLEVDLLASKDIEESVKNTSKPIAGTIVSPITPNKGSFSFVIFFFFALLIILVSAFFFIYKKHSDSKRLFNMRRYNARFRR